MRVTLTEANDSCSEQAPVISRVYKHQLHIANAFVRLIVWYISCSQTCGVGGDQIGKGFGSPSESYHFHKRVKRRQRPLPFCPQML